MGQSVRGFRLLLRNLMRAQAALLRTDLKTKTPAAGAGVCAERGQGDIGTKAAALRTYAFFGLCQCDNYWLRLLVEEAGKPLLPWLYCAQAGAEVFTHLWLYIVIRWKIYLLNLTYKEIISHGPIG